MDKGMSTGPVARNVDLRQEMKRLPCDVEPAVVEEGVPEVLVLLENPFQT